jgi:peroxiredoxin
MMKNLFLILIAGLLTVSVVSCGEPQKSEKKSNFKLHVTITGMPDSIMVFLKERSDARWITVDSSFLSESKATLSGNINSPDVYYLTIDKVRSAFPVFIEKGDLNFISDNKNLRSYKVENSKSHSDYENFMSNVLGSFDKKVQALGSKYGIAQRNGDTAEVARLENEYEEIQNDKKNAMLNFVKENNSSVVGPYIIYSNSYMFDLGQLEDAVNSTDKSLANNKYVKLLNDKVATLKKVQIGQPFIDFTQDDPQGNPVSLASVVEKNKYVLVDFWASWCQPCRGENPNVVNAFQKYHDRGFTVFGVSFDTQKDSWIKAIQDDGLTWTHVSDLKGWGNAAGKLYGIQSIPQNILIGPEGKIIARNVRGRVLQEKLRELMD